VPVTRQCHCVHVSTMEAASELRTEPRKSERPQVVVCSQRQSASGGGPDGPGPCLGVSAGTTISSLASGSGRACPRPLARLGLSLEVPVCGFGQAEVWSRELVPLSAASAPQAQSRRRDVAVSLVEPWAG
jgi:hypothetical protein